MNYQIFEWMQEGSYAKTPGETEQAYMERIFRAVCETKADTEETSFNDRIAPEFYSCDAKNRTLCLRFKPQEWQINPNGMLHGGMMATAADITFGMLARYYVRAEKSVTMELNISYMKGIQREEAYLVRAEAKQIGRHVKFLHADILIEDGEKQAAEATALFM